MLLLMWIRSWYERLQAQWKESQLQLETRNHEEQYEKQLVFATKRVKEWLAKHPIYTEEPLPYTKEDWIVWYLQNNPPPIPVWSVYTLQQIAIREYERKLEKIKAQEKFDKLNELARTEIAAARMRSHPGGISGYFDECERKRRVTEWRCGNIPRPDFMGGNYYSDRCCLKPGKKEPPLLRIDGTPNIKWVEWYMNFHACDMASASEASRIAIEEEQKTIAQMLNRIKE